jgi:3-oxoacyl-[acyl-carrier protein] reductase
MVDLGIAGKTALVLGAGGGLGGAIAASLSREGVKVAAADIDIGAAEATASRLPNSIALYWDIADLATIDGHVSDIETKLGPIDILVNNTGGPPPTPAAGQDPAMWRKQFEAMVLSVIAITDRVLPGMRARKWGRVITSTSSGVIAPIPNLAISNALRSSLVGWSKTLSREIGKDGITANIVLPGRIATNRIAFLDEARAKRENRAVDAVVAESTATIPVGRYGRPEEYGDVVAFIAGVPAAYLTGSVIRVDGGLIPST